MSKAYRDDIDRQLFRHVRVKTVAKRICVLDAAERKLPGFMPLDSDSLAGHAAALNRLQHAVSVDVEKMTKTHLTALSKFLPNVETIRLPSNDGGFHMYQPPGIGKATTMVVFPSFLPQIDRHKFDARVVPKGVTKVVQHLTCAIDRMTEAGRGPILFNRLGPHVTREVWVFTNYNTKVAWSCLGMYDDRVNDAAEGIHESLCTFTISRLGSGKVDLTLVDGDNGFENIERAYQLWRWDIQLGSDGSIAVGGRSTESTMEERLHNLLMDEGVGDFRRLHVKTWDEYIATLTKEEEAMETLPDGVSKQSRTCPSADGSTWRRWRICPRKSILPIATSAGSRTVGPVTRPTSSDPDPPLDRLQSTLKRRRMSEVASSPSSPHYSPRRLV